MQQAAARLDIVTALQGLKLFDITGSNPQKEKQNRMKHHGPG
jgi:hypothetical protein